MDFFEHQERARRQTNLFVLYFIVAVVAVALSVYLAAMAIIALVRMQQEPGEPLQFWNPEIFIAACGSTLLIISFGSLYKIWALGSSGESVALSLGGRKVPGNTRDLGERVLLNVVEEMALASGTPVPPVYIMDAESAINAFAAGTTPQNAVIGITRGAIDALNRDELQGVIAHEFSHILNGDMRLNLRLMGWLHGILVIAMIGYMIVRAFGSFGSRSSSSGDKKNGGGGEYAILLGGLALVVIGYAGVFFAQLIKAAVSRQREFLADASAVEFTRNPSGIANALKRIGGWQNQSRMRSVQAEESSHMFFGNAFTSSLFATHPPLLERVRRIEPDFSGPFAAARPIEHSLDEIIDPRSLALARDGGAAVHQAALVGAERLSQQPAELVQTVGQPREEHIEHVHGLVDNLDEPLSGDVRDPLGAVATIYALLLAPGDSALRSQQLGILRAQADPGILFEFDRILASVDALSEEQRLPVASLAFPALHQMSLPQVLDFHNLVQVLVRMDNQISLFEFAIQRYITKRLLPRLERKKVQRSSHKSLEQLSGPITVVLSTLAYAGDRSNPEHAFDQGRAGLGPAMLNASLQPREQCSVKQLDQALDDISTVELSSRKALLAAFTQCIAADGHMSIREAELLRVIADTLGCPVPPVL